ncbi:MAG: helix-turn-helix domain-containing protein [Candidatus Micrarchaeota archaeon]
MVGLEAVAPAPAPRDERFDREVAYDYPRRGRPRKVRNHEQVAEVLRLYFVEKMSMRQVADVIGVSHMSVYRMLSDPSIELLI